MMLWCQAQQLGTKGVVHSTATQSTLHQTPAAHPAGGSRDVGSLLETGSFETDCFSKTKPTNWGGLDM